MGECCSPGPSVPASGQLLTTMGDFPGGKVGEVRSPPDSGSTRVSRDAPALESVSLPPIPCASPLGWAHAGTRAARLIGAPPAC